MESNLLSSYVFLVSQTLKACDANVLSLDKIFYLAHCANQTWEKLKSRLDDEVLFGSPDNCSLPRCDRNWKNYWEKLIMMDLVKCELSFFVEFQLRN